jgi:hypothetical protein
MPALVGEHSAVAADGEVIAYDTPNCVVVDDFASGLRRTIPLAEGLLRVRRLGGLRAGGSETLLRVAGRMVAYRARPLGGVGLASIGVFDIDSDRELYRVTLPSTLDAQGDPTDRADPTFDLQPDGTLLIARADSCAATVSTIANPNPRPLGIPACFVRRVRDGRALIVVPGTGNDRMLAWTSIESPTVHVIADLGAEAVREEGTPADMNEGEVLYAIRGCYAPSTYRALLVDPERPPTPPRKCPVIVSSRRATLASGRLHVLIRCPLGCKGFVQASLRTDSPLHGGRDRGPIALSSPRYVVAPGRSTTVTIVPSEEAEEAGFTARQLRRMLRGHARLRLTLKFETESTEFGHESTRAGVPVGL